VGVESFRLGPPPPAPHPHAVAAAASTWTNIATKLNWLFAFEGVVAGAY